jgi:hypothetical protein
VIAARTVLALAGVLLAGYGAVLLWDNPAVVLVHILVWGLVAVIVHDALFAPLCVAVGFAGQRLLPTRWWSPVAVAGLCTVVLVALAVPVYDKPGMRPDNTTVLDRDYHLGLVIALAVVWLCVPAYLLSSRVLPVRQDQMIDQQGAGDVEGQPPPA